MPIKIQAKVLARSSNTNSFGLREHVIVFSTGHTFKAYRSAYTPDADDYEPDTTFELRFAENDFRHMDEAGASRLASFGFELARAVRACPPDILKEIDFSAK